MEIKVYALASDGKNGTECFIFETEDAMNDHIWRMITPDNWDDQPMTVEAWRERFDNDWSEAMETYMPDGLTFQTEEKTIEIPMTAPLDALNLYSIVDGDVINNLDLYVVAPNVPKAIAEWRDHWGHDGDAMPTSVYCVPVALSAVRAGVVSWSGMPDLLKDEVAP